MPSPAYHPAPVLSEAEYRLTLSPPNRTPSPVLSCIPPAQGGRGLGGGGYSLGLSSIIDTQTLSELLKAREVPKQTPSGVAWKALENWRKNDARNKDYYPLLSAFCRYMDRCENSGIHFKGFKLKGNNPGQVDISAPLLNRWHPARRAAWIARLYQLTNWYEATRPGCTMISLTGYQEGIPIYDTWDRINRSRTKLLKICRKYLGKFSYLWVVEPHTKEGSGYPHYHLVIFKTVNNTVKDSFGEGMEDKLRRLYSSELKDGGWGTGSHTYGLDFTVMEGDQGIENLKNYLLKYISKSYITSDGWGDAELIFNAHLWGASHNWKSDDKEALVYDEFLNAKCMYRLIGMSRDLSRLMKPEEDPDKEQIVWYHIDETEPIDIKDERGEIIEDFTYKALYHREVLPDWLFPFRPLLAVEDWRERAIDYRAELRKMRANAFIEWSA